MQHAKKNSMLANSHQLSLPGPVEGPVGVWLWKDEQERKHNPIQTQKHKNTHACARTLTASKEYVYGCDHTDTQGKRPAKTFYHTHMCTHTTPPPPKILEALRR